MSYIYYHQKACLTEPIIPSAIFGGVFAGLDYVSGRSNLTPRTVGTYMGGIYAYNAVQCPMEAIHGKRSSIHNFLAGATLGYAGIQAGKLGVPFVNPYALSMYRVSPAALGAAVYGGMGFLLAILSGKPV